MKTSGNTELASVPIPSPPAAWRGTQLGISDNAGGLKHWMKKGKTPVLNVEETRELLDAIETDTLIGLRDRALIGLMVYTFERVGAAVKMRVEDYYMQGRKGWVRLHEKGSKHTSLPCHHRLDEYLEEYINKTRCSGQPHRRAGTPSTKPLCVSRTFTR